MARLILFNKPFRVMSQFRAVPGRETLADFLVDPQLRAAGRLDYESEGLLLLSDDGKLVQKITHPRFKQEKTYWAQVEGVPDEAALRQLQSGVVLKDGRTRPAEVRLAGEPGWLWPRNPPIRYRAAIPTSWVELKISEGRNRQVRRMTAAVGHPTLRLIRESVGRWKLDGLSPGAYHETST